MLDTAGKFYLGRIVDQGSRETTPAPLLYDPHDLTTHAVVVGMTGSGKTGLCLDLLEEAALQDVPALMIDPKGDITNALLHFPELAPADRLMKLLFSKFRSKACLLVQYNRLKQI